MIVTVVSVHVKPEYIEKFIGATIINHNNSVQEPGNFRFDVLQNRDNPSMFTLYEAYASDEAAAAHKKTPHYAVWRETVEVMMAEPRKGIIHSVISPSERSQWKQ
jgi:(4S)-4-hydroxy-5-phosphonooxypentane-2,3-dione isomerase